MNRSSSDPPVIQLREVSRRYGSKLALDNVTLSIPRGGVLGLVGANGAGKTTLIKHVLGLLCAQQGNVHVFGLDPVTHSVEVLQRLGYLSEDRDLPPWMTLAELLAYTRAFYPAWNADYAENLRQRFQLAVTSRIRTLSKGELAKAGLLVALAHQPDLLVLDEPSSGLDPIVRRELLEAIVRSVAEEGRTILFSSHLLDEIARVSDRVAILAHGRIVLNGGLEEIIEAHRRLVVCWPEGVPRSVEIPGALAVSGGPREWTVIGNGASASLREALHQSNARIVEDSAATFEEIFHARVACAGATSA